MSAIEIESEDLSPLLLQLAGQSRALLWTAVIREDLAFSAAERRVLYPDAARSVLDLDDSIEGGYSAAFEQAIFVEDEIRTRSVRREALERGDKSYPVSFRVRNRHGDIQWIEGTVTLQAAGPGIWTAYCVGIDVTERKRMEEEAQRSEREFRALFELAGVGAVQVDPLNGRYLRVNRRFTEITGYTSEDLLNMTFTDITHPDDRAREKALSQDIYRENRSEWKIEKRYVRRDGKVIWVELTGNLEWDAAGKPLRTVAIIQDITERKSSEEVLQSVVRYARCILWYSEVTEILTPERSYFDWQLQLQDTDAAQAILPLDAQPWDGDYMKALWAATPREDQIREDAVSHQAFMTGQPGYTQEFRSIDRFGQVHWLMEQASVRSAGPGHWRVFGVITDLTERQQLESRMKRFFDSRAIGICIGKSNGELIFVNDAYLAMVGYSREEFERGAIRWNEITPPEYADLDARMIAEMREHGACQPFEKEYIRKDGSRIWALIGAAMGPDEEIVATFQDITERKQDQAQLADYAEQLREADRRKDEFLAVLAHELRNPLAPMLSALYLVKQPNASDVRRNRALDILERQVRHMARLIDDLLDVSRIAQGKIALNPKKLDLSYVTREVLRDWESSLREKNIQLVSELSGPPLQVEGDVARLTQVLGNLLSNAIKFTDPGGSITVRTFRRRSKAVLTVEDTGIGIAPGQLERIFDIFMQADRSLDRSRGGLGLGLALVKGIVELHGGDVRADSGGYGKGTRFSVALPLVEVSPKGKRGTEDSAASSAPPSPRARILIIEDNPDTGRSYQDVLESFGHTVALSPSGDDGLAKVSDWNPDLVVCDLGLPGVDGYVVAQAIRQMPERSGLLLIAATGYGTEEDRRRSRAAGFDAHLTKPIDPDHLQQTIIGLLEESLPGE